LFTSADLRRRERKKEGGGGGFLYFPILSPRGEHKILN